MKQKVIKMLDIMSNPRYRGRHIIIAGGKLYTAKTGEKAAEILSKLERTNPKDIPEIAYLPKGKFLIV